MHKLILDHNGKKYNCQFTYINLGQLSFTCIKEWKHTAELKWK